MPVIGIDLGTTYSAASQCEPGGKPEIVYLEGEATMPSVVGLQASGKIAVGKTAKRNQAKSPLNTIVEVKRQMGQKETVALGEQKFSPQEISAMILKKIKELASEQLGEITGAVISCPAYFKDPQRKATEEAGRIAGLKVLQIVNEPTAAAYAYGVNQGTDEAESLFVVYDLGGGTFDVTVIRKVAKVLEVLGTGGDPNLGGGDFDDRIVGWMMEHLEKIPGYAASLTDDKRHALRLRLKSYAEEGKKALCNSSDANPTYQFQIPSVDLFEGKPIVFNETLSMEKFESLIMALMEGSLGWIDEALKVPKGEKYNYAETDITAILLVGGSTRVPLVKRLLDKRFPNTPIRGQESGIDPDQIVAMGAAILASDVDPDSDEVAETILVDVTGHTLSVAVMDERKGREVLAPIIPKETQIPISAAHDFASYGHGQRECRVKVFQGEGEEIDLEKVTMIGEFLIEIAPIEQSTPLRIGLDLDKNGLLVAHATDKLSGQRAECKINYDDSSQISPEKLEEKRKAIDAQLKAVLNQTANPLDGGTPAAQRPQNAWAPPPAPDPGASEQAFPAQPMAAPADPASQMNPIMRTLYQKALNSFPKVPADRQPMLVELVSKIEAVARSGDQTQLMNFYPQLQQIMEGID